MKIKQNIKLALKKLPLTSHIYKILAYRKKISTSHKPSYEWIHTQWKLKCDGDLDLDSPKTFNQKLQWGKLYSSNDLAKKCADKYEVLDYVKDKIGKQYVNEVIAIYPNTKSIEFDALPRQFVIKATHDSGSVMIIKDRDRIDFKKLKDIERNLKVNYGYLSKEWVYNDIKPQILIEKYLESEDGKSLKDYKIFCFNGIPRLVQVDLERFEGHKRNFYDTDWNRLDLSIQYPNAQYDVPKPELLDEMLSLTKVLAKPFNHVRVDWYISNGKLIFGEMTFFHGGGFEKFNNKEWEEKMGGWFEVSKDLSY